MQSSITTTKKQCSGDQRTSLIPTLISTSMGGAVIGGSIANISGALAGGAFGISLRFALNTKTIRLQSATIISNPNQ